MKVISKLTAGVMFSLLIATVGCSNNSNTSNANGSDTMAAAGDTNNTASVKNAHADISATKSDTTGDGTADFIQKDDGTVEMNLKVHFPSNANKSVAVHLHEHGDCGDAGAGAHGHWNPTNEPHGKWGSAAYHSGDIGNIELDAEGRGEITLSSNRWSIGGDDKTNILNRSIIVHSGVDDYKSQPSGNAGSRIGCGVIMAK